MGKLKKLVGDTAIYGLSSIIGRFLNYLLVPLYTYKIAAESGGYGVVTNIYAYTALILVILTFGMETTFFRFANKEGVNPLKAFSTSLISVGGVALIFIALCTVCLPWISDPLGYADHPEYIEMMAIVVAIDAFQAILFAYLRYQKRPIKFAALKLLFIFLNIGMNLFIFLLAPKMCEWCPSLMGWYNPSYQVGYIFVVNLICTSLITFGFLPELKALRNGFDSKLMKEMWKYTWPLLIFGIIGIMNQVADKICYRFIVPGQEGETQLGIYGACVKIAMIMAMITQAFRFAYEPIVFAGVKDKDQYEMYEQAMKYFIIFTLLAFLMVVGYLDILKFLIGEDYWSGLRVVPIVMAAEIMMGIYFNLSFWYKIIDKTIWGAWFSGLGCLVLIAVNLIFVPKYGFVACAWGGFAGYGVAMVASYFIGQEHYPLNYPLKDIALYTMIAALAFAVMMFLRDDLPLWLSLAVNTILILLFLAVIIKRDLPLSKLPVIGKYFKK